MYIHMGNATCASISEGSVSHINVFGLREQRTPIPLVQMMTTQNTNFDIRVIMHMYMVVSTTLVGEHNGTLVCTN